MTDITCIPRRQGWCYLATVVNLYSPNVVGWDAAKAMTTELAFRALRLAKLLRQLKDSLLVHLAQGSQYTRGEWRDYAARHGVELSQRRRGNG